MMWRCSWPAVAAVLLLSGCSYPERGRVPEEEEGGAASSVVTVEYLKSHYRGYPYTFTESYRIRGCVVSSDRSGNYYKRSHRAEARQRAAVRNLCHGVSGGCVV